MMVVRRASSCMTRPAEKKAIRKVEKKDKEAQKKAGKAEQKAAKMAKTTVEEKVD